MSSHNMKIMLGVLFCAKAPDATIKADKIRPSFS